MRDLLEFLVKGIAPEAKCEIKEVSEDKHTHFTILAPTDAIGILIGKGGKTIKNIRNILKVRATLEKSGVSASVEEKP